MNTSNMRARVLIVDDEVRVTRLLEAQLANEGYSLASVNSGSAALAEIEREPPDIVLLDLTLPDVDGLQVAGKLKMDARTKHVPIVAMTEVSDRSRRVAAFNMGVEDVLAKPVDRAELWVRVRNLLRLKEYQNLLADQNASLERQVAERTEKLKAAHKETIFTLVKAAEFHDDEGGTHVQRISHYCRTLAETLGLDCEFVDGIFHASPMHDIGKIAIPEAVLLKPEPLTEQEWTVMRSHCTHGAKILGRGQSPYLKMAAEIALNHHENWDGSGYPNGLTADSIPLAARIMHIADHYDALRSKRPYKDAWSHERAHDALLRGDGRSRPGHFDPELLMSYLRVAELWRIIYEETTTSVDCGVDGELAASDRRRFDPQSK